MVITDMVINDDEFNAWVTDLPQYTNVEILQMALKSRLMKENSTLRIHVIGTDLNGVDISLGWVHEELFYWHKEWFWKEIGRIKYADRHNE